MIYTTNSTFEKWEYITEMLLINNIIKNKELNEKFAFFFNQIIFLM